VIIGVVVTLRVLTLDDWPVWRAVRLALPDAHNVVAFLGGRPVGLARGVPAGEAAGQNTMIKRLR